MKEDKFDKILNRERKIKNYKNIFGYVLISTIIIIMIWSTI